uniref:THUMP domain-containing protein 1 n=1 Tax=Sipha flava TaxID=143950 RepID=A0A2S2QKB6_9HEMI
MASSRPKKFNSSFVKKFNFKDNRFKLQPDRKGFLCTCSFGEKDCQKEAINLLREYSEEKDNLLEDNTGTVEESTDIMDSMDNELQNLSNKDNSDWKKFTPLATGVGNCLFIGTTIEDPCELMYKILEDIENTKVQKTKFLLRMIPISITCKANLQSITTAFIDLFAKHFSSEPTTFAIMFNHRYNNSVKRDQIINELANQVASLGEHSVDLSGGAKKTIIVEVVKSVCCLSVVENYRRFCKFNLLSVCGRPEKRTAEGENGNNKIYQCTNTFFT